MNLKKITQSFAERRRHQQGMRAARWAYLRSTIREGEPTPSDVASIAFGRYRLRLTDEEPTEFLAAVLADDGVASRTYQHETEEEK